MLEIELVLPGEEWGRDWTGSHERYRDRLEQMAESDLEAGDPGLVVTFAHDPRTGPMAPPVARYRDGASGPAGPLKSVADRFMDFLIQEPAE